MERNMIKHVSGVYYRVPEDMCPFAAQNLVNHKMAEWVERHELNLKEKLSAAVSAVKQNLQLKPRTKPDEVELSQRSSEKAVRQAVGSLPVRRPTIPVIDTDHNGSATIV